MYPGQGFKRGNLISFMAIPMPVPEMYQKALKTCAAQCKSLRLMLESTPASKTLRQEYDEAMRDLEAVEKTIRSAIGIQEARQEFLSLSALRMFSV